MSKNKKPIIISILLAIVIFVATTAMKTPPQDPGFKNLKVLPKDISKEDLDKYMHDWSAALGQRCGFCHARPDMASDAKPEKEIARKMMTMTDDLNKKYFKPETEDKDHPAMAAITCYTCHNGKAQPATKAPMGAAPGMMTPPAGGGTPPPMGGGNPPPTGGGTTTPPTRN